MGQVTIEVDEAKALEKAEAAARRAAYVEALEVEMHGYEATGREDRAAEVKAEIARAQGKGARQKAVVPDITPVA